MSPRISSAAMLAPSGAAHAALHSPWRWCGAVCAMQDLPVRCRGGSQAAPGPARRGGGTAMPSSLYCLQLVAQGADRDAEDVGGVGAVAEAMVQRLDDQVALHLGHRAADQAARARRTAAAAATCRRGVAVGDGAARRRRRSARSRPARSRRRWRAARRGAWCSPARARCRASAWAAAAARGSRRRAARTAAPLASAYFSAKWSASAAMSAGRSRSGGQAQVHDVEAEEQVLAERARRAASARGRGWSWRAGGCRP